MVNVFQISGGNAMDKMSLRYSPPMLVARAVTPPRVSRAQIYYYVDYTIVSIEIDNINYIVISSSEHPIAEYVGHMRKNAERSALTVRRLDGKEESNIFNLSIAILDLNRVAKSRAR